MITRVTRRAVLIALATLTLTGCGRQVAKDSSRDLDLPATGPDQGALPAPPPHVSAALDATGGLATWTQCKRLTFDAVVTANQPDGGYYLTEHQFSVSPWGNAIQISAQEPQAGFTCRIVDGRYRLTGESKADVSPLSVCYRDYAEAVLQITTAPARLLDGNVTLLRKPLPVMISGEWYYPIEAKYEARKIVSKGITGDKTTVVEPYWTQGVYFQKQNGSLVDIIWLANPAAQKFVLVRGYNYARIVKDGVLVPTKIEVFQSDAEVVQGQRLALIDLKQ
jgi:hypothetical protein